MGIRIKGNTAEKTALTLEKIGARSTRQLRRLHSQAASEMAEVAADMAPYKTGELETSVDVSEERAGGRKIFTVSFSAKHAIYMHEGVYDLGPGSVEKSGRVKHMVGRKYLSRAASYILLERKFFQRAIKTVQQSWRQR